jgi:hypothetical protein
LLQGKPKLVKAVLGAPHNPDDVLESHRLYFSKTSKKKKHGMAEEKILKVVS